MSDIRLNLMKEKIENLKELNALIEDHNTIGFRAGDFMNIRLLDAKEIQILYAYALIENAKMDKHVHKDSIEVFNIVLGSLKLIVNDEEIILKAGDSYTIPMGVFHSVISLTPTMECVTILIPAEEVYKGCNAFTS